MADRPRAFVEAPAGLASVSLRLHGGPHCRPPISRMGNKAGYAEVILAALGLRSGQGADAFLWCEADPDVRGLLRAYPDAAMLRRVAEIIRGWADEEPRALWERLRAERRARGPRGDEEGTAGWVVTAGWSFRGGEPESGFRDPYGGFSGSGRNGGSDAITIAGLTDRCSTLAEYATIAASNRLINMAGPEMLNTGNGGTRFGGEFATPPGGVAAIRVPRGEHPDALSKRFEQAATDIRDRIVSRWPPVAVLPTIPTAADLAELLGTPGDLSGVVVYSDPPYQGTTPYAHVLPRADVVRFALECDALGAVVCVSEAEALAELAGWHAVEITAGRRGQKRTFSKQQGEWLTMNREPAHRVAVQGSLWAAA